MNEDRWVFCCQLVVIPFLAMASLWLTNWVLLAKMLTILNVFWNLVFYFSLLRILSLTSNFIYKSCQDLASFHRRENLTPFKTQYGVSTAPQTPESKPHPTPPRLKPRLPSRSSSEVVIDKYPHKELMLVKNDLDDLNKENHDFEETDPWCQCSCVIS